MTLASRVRDKQVKADRYRLEAHAEAAQAQKA
jgi:hypothetical protein